MAPPWARTLTSTPTKFLSFLPIFRPNALPSAVTKKSFYASNYYQQSAAATFDGSKFFASPIAFCTSSSVFKPTGCLFSPMIIKNPFLQPLASYATTNLTPEDVKKEMGVISEKFGEALELLNDARSSAGTVYFSEDMKDAEVMVEDTLGHYKGLLAKLEAEARLDVQRTIGLKMEELKAQFQMIKDSIRD